MFQHSSVASSEKGRPPRHQVLETTTTANLRDGEDDEERILGDVRECLDCAS